MQSVGIRNTANDLDINQRVLVYIIVVIVTCLRNYCTVQNVHYVHYVQYTSIK